MIRRFLLREASCLLALLVLASPVLAQSTASMRGTVTDPQGAALAGAKVLVRSQATGEERTAQSDPRGEFQLASLPVGVYRLEVRADGFQVKVVTDIRLEVAQTVVQNVRLAIGSMTEEVAVVGEAPVIESTTTSVGQVINHATVQEIPLNVRPVVEL